MKLLVTGVEYQTNGNISVRYDIVEDTWSVDEPNLNIVRRNLIINIEEGGTLQELKNQLIDSARTVIRNQSIKVFLDSFVDTPFTIPP